MNVNIGDLNKRIKIIENVETKDNSGFPIIEEKVILNVWSQITNQSGTEIIKNNNDFSKVSTRFLIRTPKCEITTKMKIVYKKSYYDVKYVHDYQDNSKFTEIFAEKVE